MQPNFTLKGRGHLRLFLVFFMVVVAGISNAQQYINGNLSTGATHVGTGTAAPVGTTWSELQVGQTLFGNSANITTGFSVADNFVVPAGPSWSLQKITFFAYSTGFAGGTSPFVDTRVQIYNTDPSVGNPVPIFGDLVTNRFLSSSLANVFRTSGTAADQSRRVWRIEATVNTVLAPGTYWIEWAHGNGGLSNFTPANTVAGVPVPPGGNSKQRNFSTGLPGTWVDIVDAGGPQDQHFIIDYTSAACSGTPTPGATVSSVVSACPGVPFTLSLTNSTPGSGVTYQWQSGPSATGPWSNIGGATNATYATTMTGSAFYQCIVTCAGNPGISTPIGVPQTPTGGCYCDAGATDPAFEKIASVEFGSINNPSTSTAGYENFLTISTDAIKGQVLPITVTSSDTYTGDKVFVWIDFNQNGSFADAGELVYAAPVNSAGPFTGNVTIDPAALTGPTRMRIRLADQVFGTQNNTSCGNTTYGQVEDYTVNIVPCVPAQITSAPSSATISCGGNATFSVTASGTVSTYSWEYRTSSSAPFWQDVTNGGIYSGATTATLTLTDVPQSFSGYQYRALVKGVCTGVDFTTPPATLTVNALVPVVNPASATICLGSVQQLSLTNSAALPATAIANSGAINVPIPEGTFNTGPYLPGVSTLAIAGIPPGSVISKIDVKLNITHAYVGDVVAVLKAPNNEILNLDATLDLTNNAGVNFVNTVISSAGTTRLSAGTAPFTGVFRADAVGPVFNIFGFDLPGGPVGYIPTVTTWAGLHSVPNGNWTLALYDAGAPDIGNLTNWEIAITYVSPTLVQGTWTGPAGTMFTDLGATITPIQVHRLQQFTLSLQLALTIRFHLQRLRLVLRQLLQYLLA